MRVYVAYVRVTKDPFEPDNVEKQTRHITVAEPEGFRSWQGAIDSITEWEAEAYLCWSVTEGTDGNLMLMLFDKHSSHPHYVNPRNGD